MKKAENGINRFAILVKWRRNNQFLERSIQSCSRFYLSFGFFFKIFVVPWEIWEKTSFWKEIARFVCMIAPWIGLDSHLAKSSATPKITRFTRKIMKLINSHFPQKPLSDSCTHYNKIAFHCRLSITSCAQVLSSFFSKTIFP